MASGAGGLIGPYSGGARRLYVGNLHTNIKEEDLRQASFCLYTLHRDNLRRSVMHMPIS